MNIENIQTDIQTLEEVIHDPQTTEAEKTDLQPALTALKTQLQEAQKKKHRSFQAGQMLTISC